jgi:hypothetical protein
VNTSQQERRLIGFIASLAIVALVVCLFRVASCQEHMDKVYTEMRAKQATKEAH